MISLEEDDSCRTWIIDRFNRKISDIQDSIINALQDSPCSMSVSCVASSQFTCGTNPRIANYE